MNLSKLSAALLAATLPVTVLADNTALDQIIVTANNTEQNLRSVTANAVVINREEIEEKQYRSVTDALRSVPGISFSNNGGFGKATSLYLRGDSNGHVLVLLDGIDMTDASGLGGAHLEQISIADIERIEIIKGAQSGVWGANATAGVINIITKKSGQQASANVEFGSHGTKKISTTLGAGSEQADFSIHFSSLDTDGFSAVRTEADSHEDFEDDSYRQTDVSMKFGFNLNPHHRIQTFIKHSSADNEFDGSSFMPPYLPLPDDESATNSQQQTVKNLQYLYSAGDISAKVYVSDNQIDREYPTYFSQYEGRVNDFGAQVALNYRDQDQVSLAANRKTLTSETSDYQNSGIAVSNTNHFGSLIFSQALRYDEYDKFDNVTTGKLGVKNYFTDDIFVSANAGTAYNAPLLSQLARPNPVELKPEETESYDITVGAYGLQLTYFYNQTKDLIEYVYQPYPTPYYYQNADQEVESDGIEASFKHSFTNLKTDLSVNYTWLSARNEDGQTLRYRPETTGTLNLDYYGLNKTHLGLQTRYVGKVYSLDDKQGVQFGDYFVTDLTADYQINKHLNVYGKIVNVTDDDYTESVASATGSEADYVYSNGGRQFFIGLRASL